MGIGKKILDFLFGKDPEIFDEKGTVRHNLPDSKWKNWHARYTDSPEQNWRQHRGKTYKSNSTQQV
jgi:hypothetical protein